MVATFSFASISSCDESESDSMNVLSISRFSFADIMIDWSGDSLITALALSQRIVSFSLSFSSSASSDTRMGH